MNRIRPTLPPVAVTLALLAWGAIGPRLRGGMADRIDAALHADGLNRADRERQDRGYYEQLLDAGQQPGDFPDSAALAANAGPAASNHLTRPVPDVRETVLKPGFATEHLGARWTTSALGLRDREYAATRPPDTVRLALLGDSIGAGWGVADGAGFEPRVEAALDASARGRGGPAIEVLNFAVPGHAPGQRWEHFVRSGGWELGTDVVLYEATPADVGWDTHRLRRVLWMGWGFDAPVYRDALAQLRLSPGRDVETYKRRLRPYRWEVLEGVYRHIVSECHRRGVPCVWFLIPRVDKASDEEDRAGLLRRARAAGFDAVLDLSDAFEGADAATLAVAPGDYHPNAEGHARIARALERRLEPSLREHRVRRTRQVGPLDPHTVEEAIWP